MDEDPPQRVIINRTLSQRFVPPKVVATYSDQELAFPETANRPGLPTGSVKLGSGYRYRRFGGTRTAHNVALYETPRHRPYGSLQPMQVV